MRTVMKCLKSVRFINSTKAPGGSPGGHNPKKYHVTQENPIRVIVIYAKEPYIRVIVCSLRIALLIRIAYLH